MASIPCAFKGLTCSDGFKWKAQVGALAFSKAIYVKKVNLFIKRVRAMPAHSALAAARIVSKSCIMRQWPDPFSREASQKALGSEEPDLWYRTSMAYMSSSLPRMYWYIINGGRQGHTTVRTKVPNLITLPWPMFNHVQPTPGMSVLAI